MSRRAEERRIARFDKKGDQYLASSFWPIPSTQFHGVCRRCSRRTYLFKPLGACRRCLDQGRALQWAAAQFGIKL